jgi:glycosidase
MVWAWMLWLAACGGDGDVSGDKDGGVVDTTDVDQDGRPDPLAPARSCDAVVTFKGSKGLDVSVAGKFNEWLPRAMVDESGQGDYALNLGPLRPGAWPYKFVFDANRGNPTWESPPADVYTMFEDGIENRALYVGDCALPSLRAVEVGGRDDGTARATLQFERAAAGANLDLASVQATFGDAPAGVAYDAASGVLTLTASGLSPGKHSLRVTAADLDGLPIEEASVFVPVWVEDVAFDWSQGLMYYAFLDRFRDGGPTSHPTSTPGAITGTDYMGGDLVGALEVLESGWLEDLGVRSIWLSPVQDNPEGSFIGTGGYFYTGYHGYWPVGPRAVEGRLGADGVDGEAALHAFIKAAHARGIRVLFDVVLNHVHEEHAYLQSHPEWFTAAACPCTSDPGACNWDSNPIGCWFTDYLPDLDYKNHDIVEQLVADARWWIETFDVDGFRVDAAKHMDHVILRTFSMRMRDLYETPSGVEFYKVGETFTFLNNQGLIMDYVSDHELDGQFDFPLYYAFRDAASRGAWDEVSRQSWAAKDRYGAFVHRMSPFMGNHDVSRIATDVQGCPNWALFGGCDDIMAQPGSIFGAQWDVINKLSSVFTVVATMPGVPLLYYGDEVGLAGAGDPDNRRLMPWETPTAAQQELLDRMRAVGTLRTQHRALQVGEWKELWVGADDDLFVYARDAGAGDVALVAVRLDRTGTTRVQRVPIPAELGLEGATLQDGLGSGATVTVAGGAIDLVLNPYERRVFVR